MLEQYKTGPGRYEAEPPMAMYLDELLTEYGGYETTDDGWSVGVIGKWTLMVDTNGFVYARKWDDEVTANAMFQDAISTESEMEDA